MLSIGIRTLCSLSVPFNFRGSVLPLLTVRSHTALPDRKAVHAEHPAQLPENEQRTILGTVGALILLAAVSARSQ